MFWFRFCHPNLNWTNPRSTHWHTTPAPHPRGTAFPQGKFKSQCHWGGGVFLVPDLLPRSHLLFAQHYLGPPLLTCSHLGLVTQIIQWDFSHPPGPPSLTSLLVLMLRYLRIFRASPNHILDPLVTRQAMSIFSQMPAGMRHYRVNISYGLSVSSPNSLVEALLPVTVLEGGTLGRWWDLDGVMDMESHDGTSVPIKSPESFLSLSLSIHISISLSLCHVWIQ